ncbi:hypothetical protein MHU86_4636 [Fragilaria crotonensis]|nr:hypothetical protein MHU86_4636 [Fragilaria crotonensis]
MDRRVPRNRPVGRGGKIRESSSERAQHSERFPQTLLPKIGHLLLVRGGGIQAVHHIHQDVEDELQEDGNRGDLCSHGSRQHCFNDRHWKFGHVRQTVGRHDRLDRNGGMDIGHRRHRRTEQICRGQGQESEGRRNDEVKETGEQTVRDRESDARNKDTDLQDAGIPKVLMVDSSDEEDASIGPEGPTNDENDDPSITLTHSRVTIPNVLPVPAFIFAAILEAYTAEASKLCLAAISAINTRATQAGEDPKQSPTARKAAYVARWLWNVATSNVRENLGHTLGVVTGPVLNPRADVWSRDTHLRHLATRAAVARTGGDLPGPPTDNTAWTNLANALAFASD